MASKKMTLKEITSKGAWLVITLIVSLMLYQLIVNKRETFLKDVSQKGYRIIDNKNVHEHSQYLIDNGVHN